jgi:hypothetical protein
VVPLHFNHKDKAVLLRAFIWRMAFEDSSIIGASIVVDGQGVIPGRYSCADVEHHGMEMMELAHTLLIRPKSRHTRTVTAVVEICSNVQRGGGSF